jgi:hypothetical protein
MSPSNHLSELHAFSPDALIEVALRLDARSEMHSVARTIWLTVSADLGGGGTQGADTCVPGAGDPSAHCAELDHIQRGKIRPRSDVEAVEGLTEAYRGTRAAMGSGA